MAAYLVRRLIWALLLFLAVTLAAYVLFFLIPNDPAKLVAGKAATPADVQRAAHFLGTDRPIYVQYAKFLDRLVVHHDLGFSFANRQSVNSIVGNAAPVTVSIIFGGVVVWMLVALPIGILSALRPRSPLDRVSMTFVLIGISAHPIWIGLILSYLLGFRLHLFPIQGYCDFVNPATECGGPVQWAYHLCLPWLTFALLNAALYARMIRANVLETMNEDYVRTARAKGAPERIVLRSHILRNALLPVVTMLGMDIGVAFGGAVFTETVYSLPGLGKTAIAGLNFNDVPTVEGVIVFATLAIIAFNLVVDLLYAWIDPRIRLT